MRPEFARFGFEDDPEGLAAWREGARFFLQHLVDGDLPSNNGGWQWVAGAGTDAAPFYRIFNPSPRRRSSIPTATTSAAGSPSCQSSTPRPSSPPGRPPPPTWKPAASASARTTLTPIVDHMTARDRALARYQDASPRRS